METAPIRYCATLDHMDTSATYDHLRKMELFLLGSIAENDAAMVASLGGNRVRRFVKRHKLFTVTQKSMEVARVIAADPKTIKSCFMDLRRACEAYPIQMS